MKITSTPPTIANGISSRRKASGSGTAFADMLGAADEASATEAAHPLSSLSGVYAVQEVSDRESRRRKATRQAGLTLDALDDLRHALLMGEVPGPVLRRIREQIMHQQATTSDGELLGVLKEIEVRAAVELAKLEMSARPRV